MTHPHEIARGTCTTASTAGIVTIAGRVGAGQQYSMFVHLPMFVVTTPINITNIATLMTTVTIVIPLCITMDGILTLTITKSLI